MATKQFKVRVLNTLRNDCVALTAEQFTAVVDYLIENQRNHVDGVDCEDPHTGATYMVGHYFVDSAVADASKVLGLVLDNQVADIQVLADELASFGDS